MARTQVRSAGRGGSSAPAGMRRSHAGMVRPQFTSSSRRSWAGSPEAGMQSSNCAYAVASCVLAPLRRCNHRRSGTPHPVEARPARPSRPTAAKCQRATSALAPHALTRLGAERLAHDGPRPRAAGSSSDTQAPVAVGQASNRANLAGDLGGTSSRPASLGSAGPRVGAARPCVRAVTATGASAPQQVRGLDAYQARGVGAARPPQGRLRIARMNSVGLGNRSWTWTARGSQLLSSTAVSAVAPPLRSHDGP